MAEKPSAVTGEGTVNKPYIVHNYDEIKWACEDAEAIPEGQTTSIPVYLKLNNDIDCQEYAQDFEWEITCQHALDIDLNKFRYSLVGDGYLLKEVQEKTDEELVTILTERITRHINVEYGKSVRYGLLDR